MPDPAKSGSWPAHRWTRCVHAAEAHAAALHIAPGMTSTVLPAPPMFSASGPGYYGVNSKQECSETA